MIGFCIAAAVVAVYVLMFACCVAAGRADEAIERESSYRIVPVVDPDALKDAQGD